MSIPVDSVECVSDMPIGDHSGDAKSMLSLKSGTKVLLPDAPDDVTARLIAHGWGSVGSTGVVLRVFWNGKLTSRYFMRSQIYGAAYLDDSNSNLLMINGDCHRVDATFDDLTLILEGKKKGHGPP